MSVIRVGRTFNLWDAVVAESDRERRGLAPDDAASVSTDTEDYAPARHQPAICDVMHFSSPGDYDVRSELNPAVSHPSCAGHWLSEGATRPHLPKPPAPDRIACSNRVFLEHYVWPYLLPLLGKLLVTAKKEGCFSRKFTAFNAEKFFIQELWKSNPLHQDRCDVAYDDIPFVQLYWEAHPRPSPPLVLTEDERAVQIQRLWRGYCVRRDPEVQELLVWQQEWREINANEGRGIIEEVSRFWESQMPDYNDASYESSCASSSGPSLVL